VAWATVGASRPWGGRRPGGSRRGGATARGKIEGSEGELAHHHGNGLETTWSMGKRRWWRSRRQPSFRWRWTSSAAARVGVRRRMWERGRVKGQPQGSLWRFYRARRGERGDSRRRNGY
jgi:hypothetical protein